jgi:hypothetical protein
MAIIFSCPCGRQLQAREEYVGQTVRCPSCGETTTVPSGGPAEVAPQRPKEREEIADRPAPSRYADEPPLRNDPGAYRPREGHRDDFRMPDGPTRTSGKAIAALVLGILSLCGNILFGIPAIILAIMGLVDVSRSNGRVRGTGLAITGMILAAIGMIVVPILFLFPAIAKVREAATRVKSKNNLRLISMAMNDCEARTAMLPAGAIYGADGKTRLLSWRVALLPFLGYDSLYRQFKLDEPWDSPHNIKLLDQMPDEYRSPKDKSDSTRTYYRVFHCIDNVDRAEEPVFKGNQRASLARIGRGTSNTILVVEAADSVPWTKPDELPFPVNGSIESLLGGISSDTYNVALGDGNVMTYGKGKVNESALKAAITQNSPGSLPEP